MRRVSYLKQVLPQATARLHVGLPVLTPPRVLFRQTAAYALAEVELTRSARAPRATRQADLQSAERVRAVGTSTPVMPAVAPTTGPAPAAARDAAQPRGRGDIDSTPVPTRPSGSDPVLNNRGRAAAETFPKATERVARPMRRVEDTLGRATVSREVGSDTDSVLHSSAPPPERPERPGKPPAPGREPSSNVLQPASTQHAAPIEMPVTRTGPADGHSERKLEGHRVSQPPGEAAKLNQGAVAASVVGSVVPPQQRPPMTIPTRERAGPSLHIGTLEVQVVTPPAAGTAAPNVSRRPAARRATTSSGSIARGFGVFGLGQS